MNAHLLPHYVERGHPLTDWGLPPLIDALRHVGHSADGIRGRLLHDHEQTLRTCPAIADRLTGDRTLREALTRAIADLVGAHEPGVLTPTQLDAVKALLFVGDTVLVRDRSESLHGGARHRATLAARLLGRSSADAIRRRRQPGAGSVETDLYGSLVDALTGLDAAPSSTASLGTTPPAGTSVDADATDLLGTWLGTTRSERFLKDDLARRGSIAPCFMTVSGGAGHDLRIAWYYRNGISVAISTRVVSVAPRRRIVAVYEAFVLQSADAATPSHRGACLLDVAPTSTPEIAGPYWTDRHTQGTLTFRGRVEAVATSYAEGVALCGSGP